MVATLLLVGLVMAGCGGSSADPRLEIRHFQVIRQDTGYGGRAYDGKGELVVTNSSFSTRPLMVYVKEKQTISLADGGQEVREDDSFVLVRNGTGVIKTRHYASGDDVSKGRGAEPTYEWTIVGWTELRSGTLVRTK